MQQREEVYYTYYLYKDIFLRINLLRVEVSTEIINSLVLHKLSAKKMPKKGEFKSLMFACKDIFRVIIYSEGRFKLNS